MIGNLSGVECQDIVHNSKSEHRGDFFIPDPHIGAGMKIRYFSERIKTLT